VFYLPYKRFGLDGELALIKPVRLQPKSSWKFSDLKKEFV
jgi:hypothetical protein